MKAVVSAVSLTKFVERCLILDLEVSVEGQIRDAGALCGGVELRVRNAHSSEEAIRRLDAFAQEADCVAGHNIVAHDRRFIEACLSGAVLLDLPVVDALYQYATAAARDNPAVAGLADPRNPAVLRLIREVVAAGAARDAEVSLCGDMASDPDLIPALLDTGLRTLSVAPAALARVKAAVAAWRGPSARP